MSHKQFDKHIEKLREGKLLDEAEVKALCDRAKEILAEECNVVRVQAPVTVKQFVKARFAETFMDSMKTCWNSLELVDSHPQPITFLWATMSIEVMTVCRPSYI